MVSRFGDYLRMNKIALIAGAAAALILTASTATAATLAGQTVTVNLSVDGTSYGTQSVLVGAGDDGNFFGNTFFDLNGGTNGDEFVYTSHGSYSSIASGRTTTWTLSNLTFGAPLTAFIILRQDVAPITVTSLTPTSVSFSYADQPIHSGVNIIGQFVVAGGVPEPTTWAMMIGGFGFAGGALRRRRTVVAA